MPSKEPYTVVETNNYINLGEVVPNHDKSVGAYDNYIPVIVVVGGVEHVGLFTASTFKSGLKRGLRCPKTVNAVKRKVPKVEEKKPSWFSRLWPF